MSVRTNLWKACALASVEVVDEATGLTRYQASGTTCPPFACGTDSNHNETLVRDTSPL